MMMLFSDEMTFRVIRDVGRYTLAILQDNVTGVEYINLEAPSGIVLIPRLNPDGSLRIKKEEARE